VLTVGSFLNTHYQKQKNPPQVVLQDLVALLKSNALEAQLRGWIASNFH
jgi:hypothetical protein